MTKFFRVVMYAALALICVAVFAYVKHRTSPSVMAASGDDGETWVSSLVMLFSAIGTYKYGGSLIKAVGDFLRSVVGFLPTGWQRAASGLIDGGQIALYSDSYLRETDPDKKAKIRELGILEVNDCRDNKWFPIDTASPVIQTQLTK